SHGFNYSFNTKGGWGANTYLNLSVRPAANFNFSFGPSWSASRSLLQYVTSVTDPAATAFFGRRYVVGGLRQRSVAFDTRLSVTFSPTMTFELFAQPFFASGKYLDFKEFVRPGGADFRTFGKDVGTVTATQGSDGLVSTYTIDPDGAG